MSSSVPEFIACQCQRGKLLTRHTQSQNWPQPTILPFFWIFFRKQSVFIFGTKGFSRHGSTCGVDLLLLKHWLVSFPNPLALEDGEHVSALIMRFSHIFVRGWCWHFQMCLLKMLKILLVLIIFNIGLHPVCPIRTFWNVFARDIENIAVADNLYCWPTSYLPN